MVNKPSFGLPLVLLLAAAGAVAAQTPAAATASASVSVSSRLAGDWKSTAASVLPNSGPAKLHTAADLGSTSSSLKLTRMLLLLAPSTTQQQALTAKLADQKNSASASYRKWLTPAEYADSFANSASDVAAVVAWLESQGFTVATLPASRGWIEFSGTAGQVELAFQSKLEIYESVSGSRPVLTGPISVPAALAPLVQGLVSLDGSLSAPALTVPEALSVSVADLATRTSATTAEALTPNLAAQLIGLDTLQAAGVTGAGESIAIPTRSNVRSSDVDAFRSAFGLPAQTLRVATNGADPGLTSDQAEATLATSWAGVAAPGAQVVLVPAATTAATDGVDLALAAIVDGALAHTVAVGYSACEAGMSPAHQAFYEALYKQAAAEGIAVVAATGDSGASACHPAGSTAPVSTGYAVNALASTPWNTAVGVAAYGASTDTFTLKAWSQATTADPEYASGGGSSTVYAVPDWQAGSASAVSSAAQKRLLPDVVLPTALDSGVNHGLAFCLSGSEASESCTLVRSGGSSAATALFAGIAALVAEKNGAQGSLQSTLYSLTSKSGVYADVAQGKAQLSCTAGTAGCDASGEIGYSAASGYDLTTGLGSVNASALVNNWVTPMLGSGGTTVGISVSPNQIGTGYNPSTTVTFTSTVTSTTGGSTPTGTVTFYDSTVSQSLTLPVTLSSGTATATLASGSGLASGDNLIIAQYSGDNNYAAVNSSSINVHTQASTTSLTVTPSVTTVAPGQYITATAALTVGTPPAGAVVPTGIITLYVDGNQSATASISTSTSPYTATFSNVLIPANSTATSHTLLAIYLSNTDYVGSPSSSVTVAVAKTTPTVTLTPSTTTPLPGSSLTLTASVTPTVSESVVPSGAVSFYEDGSLIGTATTVAGSSASTATYTLTVSSTIGSHTFYAVYGGDSNFNTSTSSTVSATITKGTPTLTLTPSTTTPTGGSTMTLTATLAQNNSTTIVPTGTVSFSLDGGSFVGTTLSSDGTTATTSFTAPTYGTHTLLAVYNGDTEYNSVTSAQVTITVAKIVTTLVVTPSSTSVAAGSTMSASVTITPNSYLTSLPSGTVTFLIDGSTSACAATVVQGSPSTATCSFTAPAAGSHTIYATYAGDTYYATSSAYSSSFTTTKTATTTTVVPATTTPSAGNSLSVTATVYPGTAQSTLPSGTVTFTLDGVSVGSATVTSASPATATLSFTVASSGTHILGATYSGDTYYSTSTASTVTLNAIKSTPTVTVTPSTTAPSAGSSMTLTATITPPTTGATAATGTVSFSIDGTVVGTGAVNSGTATLTTTAPTTLGSHTVSATYNGDTNYNSASSSSAGIIVSKVTTTLTVTPASTTPAANSNMFVTATLAASTASTVTASGTVTFTLDGTVVATSTLSGGTLATATITVPATGTHAIQANYSGDSYYLASTATPVNITVAKTVTSTVVTPSTTTPALNTTLPVTVTVTPTTVNSSYLPSGTVTISVDGVATSVQVVTSGNPATASATLPAMTPGAHTLTAVYSGDTYYATSTSTSVTVTVPKVTTATTVTPATNTPSGGSSLAVSASVTPTTTLSTLPTGTVSFTIDGVSVSSVAVTSGSPAAANTTLSSSSLTPGTHSLAAVYSGDTNYATSTSAASTLTISKSSTTTTVIPSTLTPTAGGSMTVSVNVTSANLVTAMPSGIVTLKQDGVAVGTGTLVTGSPSVATITLNVVSAGTHVLEATYAGDTYYTASNSSTVSIIANRGASTTTVTVSPATLVTGTTETLTATLAPTTSVTGVTYTLTGTVKFYDKTTLLGTVTVTNNTAVLSGVSLKDNVSHSITAIYSGDTNWAGSTSAAVPLNSITLPDYVVLTSNYSKAPPGVAVVLTATVTPTSTSTTTTTANPSGYVDFYNGTTLIGRAALKADTTTSASTSSVATLTTQTLPGGQDTIYAFYEGDDAYDAATSNTLTITVQDFTITASSTNPATNLTIVKGASGSASYDIAGEGGFNNEVQVICTVPQADNMTCTASPQQVIPTGTVTFVIQTFKSGTIASKSSPLLPWSKAVGGTALAMIGFLFLPFGRRTRRFLFERAGKSCAHVLLLLLLLTGLVGTGVGCTSSTAVNTSTGTPLGVATVKITATAYVDNTVVSHSVYLTVNVVSGT